MTAHKQKFVVLVIAFALFVFAVTGIARALQVGDKAPDFDLDSTAGGKVTLSSLKGKNVLLNFYQLDFNPG